ncbi:MAG: MMPL family transporter [Candidatus Cryptobacteroides sp.]
MTKAVISIYNFLKDRKWLMYLLLVASTAVFAFFGFRVRYEENIAKLLPATENSRAGAVAFDNIKVKDKIFIQIAGKDGPADAAWLGEMCDEFVDSLMAADQGKGYIGSILSRIDADDMSGALYYLLDHLPSFVDTSCYSAFDSLLTEEAIMAQMAVNREIIDGDMDGSATTAISFDPAGLGKVALGTFGDIGEAAGGYALVDRQLFCPDTTVALAFLSPNFNSLDSKAGSHLVEMIEKEAESFEASHPDVQVLFHGSPVQSVFNARRIKMDLLVTVGISLLVVCILLGMCFRSLRTVFQLLAPVAYGALFSLACIWRIKGGMSVMALGIGAIVMGVALSYCLHIVTHFKYVGDPVRVLRDETVPVTLGVLTTVGAFVGLLFTGSELLRDFGMFASLAMAGTLVFILIFLPHFLGGEADARHGKAFSLLERINSYPYDRVGWLKWAIAAVCAMGCIFSGRVQFDSDLKNIGWNEPKVTRSRILYDEKNNHGLSSVYYAASAEDYEAALAGYGEVLSVMDSLKSAGVTGKYSDVSPILVGEAQQRERIARWKGFWDGGRLERTRDAVSRAAVKEGLDPGMFSGFYDMVEADYETCDICADQVLPEGLLCNFVEKAGDRWLVFTSAKMPAENVAEVNRAVDGIEGAVVIDPFWYTRDMAETLNEDFKTVVWVSSLFVLVVLLVSFRSILTALLAFMPMALSWFSVNGLMAVAGLEFNLINIVIATFIFGIGVDYSIFVTNGLIDRARGRGDSMLTYHKTAIFLSAVVLIVVTGSLVFASHPAIKSIGVSTLIGMSVTILITYTLQPALFRLMLKSRRYRERNGLTGME